MFGGLRWQLVIVLLGSPDVVQVEEDAGQRLLDMEEEKHRRDKELRSMEEQLNKLTAKSQITDSEIQYPSITFFFSYN